MRQPDKPTSLRITLRDKLWLTHKIAKTYEYPLRSLLWEYVVQTYKHFRGKK